MTDTQLYSYLMTDVILSDAISQCKGYLKEAIALLYSPTACQFAKLDEDGDLINSKGKKIELDYQKHYIFEARLFNPDYELRWLNDHDGQGNAVLITDIEVTNSSIKSNNDENQLKPKPILEKINQTYLLWGENANNSPSDGWLTLSTARIGKVEIPFNDTLKDDHRVYLNTVEYLAEIDDYGNVAVIEERLVKLTKHPLPSNST